MLTYILTILSIASVACGHSHLANPLPTRRLDCRIGNRRLRACSGPCPPLDTYGEPTGVSGSRPAASWRRGETRTITWHRNNHGDGESGFVRFSLVPVDRMMDKNAHIRYTFQISCWSSGLHSCTSRNVHVCGNDAEGKAYRVAITVPTAYPDGVYVFGWAWYGGGDYRGRSFFGDYYSCSFVRIRGGTRPTSTWRPVFIPGYNQLHNDACLSATDRLGVCVREPCHAGAVTARRPADLPRLIRGRDFSAGKGVSAGQSVSAGARGGRSASFSVHGMRIIDIRTKNTNDKDGYSFSLRSSAYRSGFTLALRTSGRVTSVKFEMRGYSHTEYYYPFIINGNDGNLTPFNVCQRRRTIVIDVTVTGIGMSKQYRYKIRCV